MADGIASLSLLLLYYNMFFTSETGEYSGAQDKRDYMQGSTKDNRHEAPLRH